MPPVSRSVGEAFQGALVDGRVTWREAETLIAAINADGRATRAEKAFAASHLDRATDAFEPGALRRFDAFIGDLPNVRSLPRSNPSVLAEDRAQVGYEVVDGALFVDGASATDVVQGYIGDCFLVAALSAVAAQDPAAVRRAIRANADGTFTVRFSDPADPSAQVSVVVDGALPTRDGSLRYGSGADAKELWVPLLEKAFAKWQGGYDRIGRGGVPGDVLTALTGRPYQHTAIGRSARPEVLHEQLTLALDQKRAVVLATSSSPTRYLNSGLYANHSYTVLRAFEEDGKRYVELRNPWGESEPEGNGPDDGVFRLEAHEAARLFVELYAA
jgi:hypothetical protein